MTIDEMIAVLQAAKAGKQIEARPHDMSQTWFTVIWTPENRWQFDKFDYRVKPEPREGWIHPNDLLKDNQRGQFDIKVREVLE